MVDVSRVSEVREKNKESSDSLWSPIKKIDFKNVVLFELNTSQPIKETEIKEYTEYKNRDHPENKQKYLFFKQKWEIIATFATPMDLHAFPLDSQILRIVFREGPSFPFSLSLFMWCRFAPRQIHIEYNIYMVCLSFFQHKHRYR